MANPRRLFLKVLAAGPLLACSAASGDPQGFEDAPAGNVSATSVGTLVVVPNAPCILGRDQDGLYAMTNTCPHQGCDVSPAGGALSCPCHGSRFNANGAVLAGPASSPLVHFAVSLDAAGNVTVHGQTRVGADVRTAVA
jgi:Rieske Fe-S protein